MSPLAELLLVGAVLLSGFFAGVGIVVALHTIRIASARRHRWTGRPIDWKT